MAANTHIIGENNNRADVIGGGLVISQTPAPAPASETLTLPYVNSMTVNGDGVTDDLRVDGSITEQRAYIEAESGADIYIKQINVLIEDNAGGSGISLNEFGALPALTNGLLTFFESKNVESALSERPLFSNFDVLRIGSLSPDIGSDDTAFRLQGAKNSTAYGYLSRWDLTNLAPGVDGVLMRANTNQKIGIRIRDDLTALDTFEIICLGYRRFV